MVEPGPTPDVLRHPVRQSPAAAEAVPQERFLVDLVGVGSELGGAVVHSEQVAPLSPEHGIHPGGGDHAVRDEHLHVHAVVDQLGEAELPKRARVHLALRCTQKSFDAELFIFPGKILEVSSGSSLTGWEKFLLLLHIFGLCRWGAIDL